MPYSTRPQTAAHAIIDSENVECAQYAHVGSFAQVAAATDGVGSLSAAGGRAEPQTAVIMVHADWHGKRLDRLLQAQLPAFSRSCLQQLIADDAVQVNGVAVCKPARKMRLGEQVRVVLRPTPQANAFVAEPMPLETVYEDEHLRVISKPAGLVVHPAAGNWSGTLLNGLLALDDKARELPRAGIVHRLDKNTSGLMLVARSRQAMDALTAAIAAREVQRQYLAIVHGVWTAGQERTVEAAIGRDRRNRIRMAVVNDGGKPARTDFLCVGGDGVQYSLLRCTLHTGRTHQIRVHAAHMGCPLLGDSVYGGRSALGMERQALHAWRLELRHPADGQMLRFEVAIPRDLPADFAAALQQVQGSGS